MQPSIRPNHLKLTAFWFQATPGPDALDLPGPHELPAVSMANELVLAGVLAFPATTEAARTDRPTSQGWVCCLPTPAQALNLTATLTECAKEAEVSYSSPLPESDEAEGEIGKHTAEAIKFGLRVVFNSTGLSVLGAQTTFDTKITASKVVCYDVEAPRPLALTVATPPTADDGKETEEGGPKKKKKRNDGSSAVVEKKAKKVVPLSDGLVLDPLHRYPATLPTRLPAASPPPRHAATDCPLRSPRFRSHRP